jgi:hypothetical protein
MVRVPASKTPSSVCTSTRPSNGTTLRTGVRSRNVTPRARAREMCAELTRRMSRIPVSAW